MLARDWPPTASFMAAESVGSTLKVSAIQDWAISIDSASSAVRVPSFRLEPRKSIMARARRFLLSVGDWCC